MLGESSMDILVALCIINLWRRNTHTRLSPINTHGRKAALEVQANHAPGPVMKADSERNNKAEPDDAVIETQPSKSMLPKMCFAQAHVTVNTRKISVNDESDIHGPYVRHGDRPCPPASNARNTN